jgi:hypothetical protein
MRVGYHTPSIQVGLASFLVRLGPRRGVSVSSSDLIRWGGIAAMLCGVAFIVLMLIPEGPIESFSGRLGTFVFIVALVLLLAALVGFHTLQKDSYGRIGRAGFYTVLVGASAQLLAALGRLFGSTALEFLDIIGLLGVFVGLVLYGAASLQARVLPRWCGVGFIVSVPVFIIGSAALGWVFGGALGGILFGLLWIALGYVLWSLRGAASEQPSRVS